MLTAGPPPWHLWGNTQELTLPPVGGFGFSLTDIKETTLVRASYGRPESWRFLFHARFLSGGQEPTPDPVDPSLRQTVNLSFDLIVGIGRSAVQIPDFVTIAYEWGALPGDIMTLGTVLWACSAAPFRAIGTSGVEIDPRVDTFVAQDVTVVCRHYYLNPYLPVPAPVRVAVSCQISPATHVRPDWMLQGRHLAEQFPGGEIGAR